MLIIIYYFSSIQFNCTLLYDPVIESFELHAVHPLHVPQSAYTHTAKIQFLNLSEQKSRLILAYRKQLIAAGTTVQFH